MRIEKPWGYEEIWAKTDAYVGKVLFIKKGHKLSYQYHKIKEETIRILDGEMDFEVEHNGSSRKTISLKPGNNYHIPAGTKHRMIAVEDCTILEVSTPHLDDVVRLEDEYGRADDGDPSLRSG